MIGGVYGEQVNEAIGVLDALRQWQGIHRLRVIVRGQSVQLLDVEHGVTFIKGISRWVSSPCSLVSVLVTLLA